jgi:hypothetical protein
MKKLMTSAVVAGLILGALSTHARSGSAEAATSGEAADSCWCANAQGVPGPSCTDAPAQADCAPRGQCQWLCN